MMTMGRALVEIEAGDYVRLLPRESPHPDAPEWWWRVVSVNDYAFNAVYERFVADREWTKVIAHRLGVSPDAVREHRKPS